MKSINTLLSALFFLSAIVGITSCTEEADYTPAQKPENAQVYFATDEASTVSLETGQQSFMVSIYRISPKGALTVNITSQDESGIFTIPSSVTFAEGTTKAEIPVSFDFDKLEPEKKYPISFAIDGNSELSEYGNSELVLNVQYAPWGAWEKFGTGVYTYSLYWGGKDIFIASNHYLMLTNFSLKFLHGEQIKIQNLLLTIISLPTKLKCIEKLRWLLIVHMVQFMFLISFIISIILREKREVTKNIHVLLILKQDCFL